jgi:RNA polymerase sigma-70 factor (ECF subfamily)
LAIELSTYEEEIIEGCQKGDPKAQEKLYQHFFGYVASIAHSYCKTEDEGSEIINESFLKIFCNIHKLENLATFKGYLRRTTINTAIDLYRSSKKHYYQEEITERTSGQLDSEAVDQLNVEDILGVLQQLPDHYRLVFNLYEIEGYKHDEISEMLGIPQGTCRSNLTRAKKMLRELIIKKGLVSKI